MELIHQYTIKLLRYVLNGDIPNLPENIDFEALFAFSKSHDVENMIYVGLRDLKIEVPEPTMEKFKEAYKIAIMLEAMQALELEAISDAFEEAGIDHVPLKSSVIKYLYPMPDYRKSGDIDILIRPEDEDKIDEVMFNMGYKREEQFENYEVHFAYIKPPCYEIEIHRQLLKTTNRAYTFCKKVWNNLTLHSNKSHCYELNNEFMYTYMLAHLCNHLYMGGAGIRIFMDFYIMRKKILYNEKLLKQYLNKANLSECNELVICIIDRWFNDSYQKNKTTDVLENIIFNGGSFGTAAQGLVLKVNDSLPGRIYTLFRRVFPSKYDLLYRCPELVDKNLPWLFLWIYRAYHILRYKRFKIKDRVKETIKNKKEKHISEITKAIRDR